MEKSAKRLWLMAGALFFHNKGWTRLHFYTFRGCKIVKVNWTKRMMVINSVKSESFAFRELQGKYVNIDSIWRSIEARLALLQVSDDVKSTLQKNVGVFRSDSWVFLEANLFVLPRKNLVGFRDRLSAIFWIVWYKFIPFLMNLQQKFVIAGISTFALSCSPTRTSHIRYDTDCLY